MADISLREYLAKLDTLLNQGASEEVIHHCRHILQYFPKNVAAYRYLGLALANAGTWEKAGEVFRRVLSVYPDDYASHVELSEVYSSLKRPDDAIWHLERAYEQDPNNQEIINTLREMYRKYRHVEQSKLQLTAGAVARQYIRNGLYEQAIDTLKQALERSPERVDLRLLLARTYSDAGRQVEAGETAVEVLNTLPDCLEANEILTEMWLSVHRPSDAQRYLNRIQSLDPYRAMELAEGKPVPNEQFRLEELDYRRSAQKEIVSRTPDWLQDIAPSAANTGADADLGDWMSTVSTAAPAEEEEALPEFDDDLFSTELPDDWLTPSQPENQSSEPVSTGERSRTGLTGLLASLDAPDETQPAQEAEPAQDTSFDDLFSSFETTASTDEAETSAEVADEFPDLFSESAQPPSLPSTSPVEEADPLAWMHESGIELVEEPETALFDDEDELAVQAADEVNPLAWLEGYGDHLITDEAKAVTASASEEAIPATEEAALDWMQQDAVQDVAEETPVQERLDPLDWLADESLLEEALSLESLTNQPDMEAVSEEIVWAQDTTQQSDRQDVMAEENPLAWLNSQDDDQQPQEEQQPELSGSDWFADLGASPTDEDEPAAEFGEGIEWLSAEEQPTAGTQDWPLAASGEESSSEPVTMGSDFEWMSGGEIEAEEPVVTAGDKPGWLSQLESQGAESENPEPEPSMPDWLTEVQPQQSEEEPAAEAADVPDWLAEVQPQVEETAEPSAVGDEFQWMAEATKPEEESVAEAADVPDWLAAVQPQAEELLAEEAPTPPRNEFEWIEETAAPEEALLEAEAAVPDWLAEVQPQAEEPPAEEAAEPTAVGDEFEWMAEAATPEEPAAADVPDWLAEVQPQAGETQAEEASEPAAVGDEFEWMAEATESEEPSAANVPDWLAEVQPQAEELAAEAAAEPTAVGDELEWMAETAASEGEPAAEAAAVPDWLAEMQSRQPETQEPVAEEAGWLSQDEEVEEEAPAESSETAPDWLAEMQSRQPKAAEPAVSDEPGWMSDLSAEEEVETGAVAGEVPDWLSQLEPQQEEPEIPEPETAGEPAWLNDLEPVEDAILRPAEELSWTPEDEAEAENVEAVPDWMSELQPQAEAAEPESEEAFDWAEDENEPQPIASTLPASETGSEFDWGDEPESVTESGSDDNVPDWLSEVQSSAEPEDASEEPASGEFSWIDDINAPDEEVEEEEVLLSEFPDLDAEPEILDSEFAPEEEVVPAPASNAPDWLNAMVPGLDVDYAASEDEPIEQTFAEQPAAHRITQSVPAVQEEPTPRKGFDWLVELVDEETREVPAVRHDGERRRFSFSRLPAWLRRSVEQRDDAPSDTGQAAETDDDSDLPPWLR